MNLLFLQIMGSTVKVESSMVGTRESTVHWGHLDEYRWVTGRVFGSATPVSSLTNKGKTIENKRRNC